MLSVQATPFSTNSLIKELPNKPLGQLQSRQVNTTISNPELDIKKIEEVFLKNFNAELNTYKTTNDQTSIEATLIKQGVGSFVRSSQLPLKNRTTFMINFALNLNSEDEKKYRKTHDSEIGFFNFKVSVYKPIASDNKVTVSYFSEVSLEKPFQSCGLFTVIMNTYNKTLRELEVDIDYLHVNSQMSFTASLYSRKGYEFTAETLANIEKNYGSKEEYLKDSSVSYNSDEHIEMFRVLRAGVTMESSVEQLERKLGS